MGGTTTSVAAGVTRRNFIRGGTAGAAAIMASVLAAPAAASTTGRRAQVVLDVDTDGFADFQIVDLGAGGGPFYVSGAINWPGTAKRIGTFHCWGFIVNSGANAGTGLVTQEFEIDGRGKIIVAGVESDAPRAVTGGTGHFRNVRGEGFPDLTDFDAGKFGIAFELIGFSGPPIR